MRLVLTESGEEGLELGYRARYEFDHTGGVIGRNNACRWVLPDPSNTVSARHATISYNGYGFVVTDTSTNGTFLNTVDAPIGRGNDAILSDGDTLYIGRFVLSVAIIEDRADARQASTARPAAPQPAPQPAPRVQTANRVASPGPFFDALTARPPGVDPPIPRPPVTPPGSGATADTFSMDDLLGKMGSPPPAQTFAAPAAPSGYLSAPNSGAKPMIPDDFLSDILGSTVPPMPSTPMAPPFAMRGPMPQPASNGFAPPSSPGMPFSSEDSSLTRSTPRGGIPADFSFDAFPAGPVPPRAVLPAPSAPTFEPMVERPPIADVAPSSPPKDPFPRPGGNLPFPVRSLAADMVTLRPPGSPPVGGGAGLDPVAVLRRRASAGSSEAASPVPPADVAPVLPDHGQAPLPSVAPRPAPRARSLGSMPLPGATPVADAASAGDLAPFWQGLGIDPASLSPDVRTEMLRECGAALREALNGIVPVLAARRSLKDTFRMEQTQLQGQDNNPLKFLPSGDAVVQAMAARKLGGFLPLAQSFKQGFRDIQAHEVAAIVSLQSIVTNILNRLAPAAIEERAGSSRVFGLGSDKGKLWDQFVALHTALTQKSDDTTREIVNKEFARAYDEQVRVAQGDP